MGTDCCPPVPLPNANALELTLENNRNLCHQQPNDRQNIRFTFCRALLGSGPPWRLVFRILL